MKTMFASILIAFMLFAFITPQIQAQQNPLTKGYSVVFDLGTVANSSKKTGTLDLRGWSKVDSVTVSISASNETDIDTVNFWVGNYTQDGFIKDAAAGVLYQACALDIAVNITDFINLVTTGATRLTGSALRGCNAVYFEVEAASSGNDATDPNAAYLHFKIHGTK